MEGDLSTGEIEVGKQEHIALSAPAKRGGGSDFTRNKMTDVGTGEKPLRLMKRAPERPAARLVPCASHYPEPGAKDRMSNLWQAGGKRGDRSRSVSHLIPDRGCRKQEKRRGRRRPSR